MKVQTDLKAGVDLDEIAQSAQSALASGTEAVTSAGKGIVQGAQGVLNNPQVQETLNTLKWWPFGPPQS
jgi:hypothetical protein